MKTFFCMLFIFMAAATVYAAPPVTVGTLLDEMSDRAAVARFPDPSYKTYQASSYDRASVAPDKPGWFANGDSTRFEREETNDGRREWVLMDRKGPGAVVRFWITAKEYKGVLRFYVDGSKTPVLEAQADKLIGGDYLAGEPFAAVKARGLNLYFPIPYKESIKITVDRIKAENEAERQASFYYQVNYRTYAPGTEVVSFDKAQMTQYADKIAEVGKKLLASPEFAPEAGASREGIIKSGQSVVCELPDGSRALRLLNVKLQAVNLAQALRSTILEISFDDAASPQVFCPVGDFFGSGVGVNPYRSFYDLVTQDGTMSSFWVMPYRNGAKLTLRNTGTHDILYKMECGTDPWEWDDRSMYFHANWRSERDIKTIKGGLRDWEYLKAQGKGVFVGDVLALVNRHERWWGEGDEKIYVDDETFPSHFGTGTEDYYGYAWCTPAFFEAPFHAQPRAEGPRNYGNVTNLRVRSLDAIPFEKNFRFDMEIWHSQEAVVDYTATTFWYGLPGAEAVGFPVAETIAEAQKPVAYKSPKYVPDLSKYKLVEPYVGNLSVQRMSHYGRKLWEDDDQLFWTRTKKGDKLGLRVEFDKEGRKKLYCRLTKAPDYATVQFWLDDRKIGEPVDLYHESVVPTNEILVGEIDAAAGKHVLGVEIIGKNEKSKGVLFGLDTFRFE